MTAARRRLLVATAGHVDHGKSTLVRVLTGMEPDRWHEERRRGLTIDLGFAWTTFDDGLEVTFVDVPGHERFIANTLSGLGPAPAVLFAVAADAGWSAQSEEHLAAIDALGVAHALLVITRSDLADPQPALAQALERMRRSSLGDVEAVTVSAKTGQGLASLRAGLTVLAEAVPPPEPSARVRLWIDRTFSVRGSGTVVTGTLGAGTVRVGDTVLLGERAVVVRSLQSLGRSRAVVEPVARVALNLRGVATGEVGRGDLLLSVGDWHHTRTLDVRLTVTGDVERLPARPMMHIGTAAIPVHLRPLGADTARVTLPHELPLLAGDRAILRDTGRHTVIGGIEVLDADPPALRRRGAAAERAGELSSGRPDAYHEIVRRGAARRDHLDLLGIAVPDRPDLHAIGDWVVTDVQWQAWVAAASDTVVQWAAQHPIDPSMPRQALVHRLALPDEALLAPILAAAGLGEGAGRVAAPMAVTLGPAEPAVRALEVQLFERPFDAPDRDQLRELRLGRRELAAAEKAQRVIRVDEDIVLLPDAPGQAVELLTRLPQPFTLSQARQALGTSRRVAVPLLEYLDRNGLTHRIDDLLREVCQSPSPPPVPANERTARSAAEIDE